MKLKKKLVRKSEGDEEGGKRGVPASNSIQAAHVCLALSAKMLNRTMHLRDAARLHSPLDGFMSSASRDANHPNCHTLRAYYSDPTEG